jgi:hypothetical protein
MPGRKRVATNPSLAPVNAARRGVWMSVTLWGVRKVGRQ